jgi:hypothetical protein
LIRLKVSPEKPCWPKWQTSELSRFLCMVTLMSDQDAKTPEVLDPISAQEQAELARHEHALSVGRLNAASERHKRFALIWFYGDAVAGIEPLNNVAAYRAVYGQHLDSHSASTGACQLLKHPDVIGELHALRAKLQDRALLDAEAIKRELAYLVSSNIIEVLPDGETAIMDRKHLKSLPEHVQHAIGELDEIHRKDGSIVYKIKMHSKTKAIDIGTKVERLVGDKKLVNNGVIVNIKGDD